MTVDSSSGETLSTRHLSPDQPLSDPEKDVLGYAPFAQTLARSLQRMMPTEGLVIALYGRWGAGKSTVLNFVEYYLSQDSGNQNSNTSPIWFQFNPWWFSGREDLTLKFFSQMRAQVGDKIPAVREHLANFGEALSSVPTEYLELLPYVGSYMGRAHKALKMLKGAREEKDVIALKGKIADELEGLDRKIIVVIDDIDRLTPREIQTLFRTIKAVADFPNVVYLVAFDKDVVEKALKTRFENRGSKYIDKIVQVPFTLPKPKPSGIQELLTSKLTQVLADAPEDRFDRRYWTNIYSSGLRQLISTPRDVHRLVNSLSVTFPGVADEVNPVDFVAIEAIRLHYPSLYSHIRGSRKFLTSSTQSEDNPFLGMGNLPKDEKQETLEHWLSTVPDTERENAERLIMTLFPHFLTEPNQVGEGQEARWRRRHRICSSEYFDVYFRLSLEGVAMTSSETSKLIEATQDAEKLSELLADYATQHDGDDRTKAGLALDRLLDYTLDDTFPEDRISSIVKALFDVGDKLIDVEDEIRSKDLFPIDNNLRIEVIIHEVLPCLPREDRLRIAKEAIESGDSVATAISTLTASGQQLGRYGAEEPSLESQQLFDEDGQNALEDAALEKIVGAAEEGNLSDVPRITQVLRRWKDWGDEEEMRHWLKSALEDDGSFMSFLTTFAHHRRTSSSRGTRRHLRLDPRAVEEFIDTETVLERIQDLKGDGDLTDSERAALRQFEYEYNLLQEEKEPDKHDWYNANV